MDAARSAVRVSVLAAVGLLAVLAWSSAVDDGPTTHSLLTTRDGGPFVLRQVEGAYEAQWRDEPVLVVVTRQAVLDGVERIRGDGEATEAVPLPGGLAVFAFSARSNFRGCTGQLMPQLGASKDIADYDGDGRNDGRFMDRCHHGQWDLFHRGAPVPVTPTCGPLAALDLALRDGALWASGFDGPVGTKAAEDCWLRNT